MRRKGTPPPVLTGSELAVLEMVRTSGPAELRDIRFSLDLDKEKVRRWVARLVRLAFLESRGKAYVITSAGRAAVRMFARKVALLRKEHERLHLARNGQPA